MLKIALVVVIALGLAACTDTADVFPLNVKAHALGPVTATFKRTGTGRGPVTVTMGDGEVLHGEYRVAFSSAMAWGFSGQGWGEATAIGDGPVQFVARGPHTQMLCRGFSTTMGHGNGKCQTFDGALWAISW